MLQIISRKSLQKSARCPIVRASGVTKTAGGVPPPRADRRSTRRWPRSAPHSTKLRVERQLRRGPLHPAVRARFGARAALLRGRNLDAAIALAERWWRDERRAFLIASALGRGVRLPLDVLQELRLILRLMRCKRMHAEFPAIIAALCDEPDAMAAE